MSQNDTYKYEAVINSTPKASYVSYEIQNVSMLTPILVKATSKFLEKDKNDIEITGQLDYVNKKVYLDQLIQDPEQVKEKILEFLNQHMILPDDMYEAPEEVYEEASRAQGEHDAMRAEHT